MVDLTVGCLVPPCSYVSSAVVVHDRQIFVGSANALKVKIMTFGLRENFLSDTWCGIGSGMNSFLQLSESNLQYVQYCIRWLGSSLFLLVRRFVECPVQFHISPSSYLFNEGVARKMW